MSSHPDKHIREAIEFAESLGWTFEKSGPRAHSFGILYCPQNERGACRIVVYSTPKTPFLHASELPGRSTNVLMEKNKMAKVMRHKCLGRPVSRSIAA